MIDNNCGDVSEICNVLVHPCVIAGRPVLVYERGLNLSNNAAFELLSQYSNKFSIDLLEDRRREFIPGVMRTGDPLRSNLLPLLLLTGILATTSGFIQGQPNEFVQYNETEQTQVIHEISLESNVVINENELIRLLLDWLTNRTAMEYNRDHIPEVKRASNEDLLEIAFSKNVPLASDMSKVSIFGLYNFKTNTIFLRNDVNLKTPEGKAVFLHELVHYLQYQNKINLDIKSVNELESLAYMLESRYLVESGYVLNFNNASVEVM